MRCGETRRIADQQRPLADAAPPGVAIPETIGMAVKVAAIISGKFTTRRKLVSSLAFSSRRR
jgi:hypothetical protein